MRGKRRLLAAVVMFGALVGLSGAADAHYVYEKGRVYESDSICTDARGEVSHGGGGGYAKADVYGRKHLFTPWGGINCFADDIRPTGYLAARFDWHYFNGSSWVICAGSGWSFSPNPTHQFAIYYDFGATPWCGTGYYGTTAHGYNLNGGVWNGGPMWSGQHHLPA